jgi:hypothetical protein
MQDIEKISQEIAQKSAEFKRADILLWTIQQQADLFQMQTGLEPTIFMSYDLFALLVSSFKDAILFRVGEGQSVHTICGYDLELIQHGKELLYVGYKININ